MINLILSNLTGAQTCKIFRKVTDFCSFYKIQDCTKLSLHACEQRRHLHICISLWPCTCMRFCLQEANTRLCLQTYQIRTSTEFCCYIWLVPQNDKSLQVSSPYKLIRLYLKPLKYGRTASSLHSVLAFWCSCFWITFDSCNGPCNKQLLRCPAQLTDITGVERSCCGKELDGVCNSKSQQVQDTWIQSLVDVAATIYGLCHERGRWCCNAQFYAQPQHKMCQG